MSSITNEDFIQALKTYHSDRMMESALKDVCDRFLESTGRKQLSGIRYATLCLLVAQAMENMLSGYGGSQTVDSRYISEAIGYQLGALPALALGRCCDRYQQLFDTVYALQQDYPAFNQMIDATVQRAHGELLRE